MRFASGDTDPALRRFLSTHLSAIAALSGARECRLTVAVVDDRRMTDLHSRYLGIAGTTDVLTFDLRPTPEAPLEGDIAVCRDEAARQARRRGHTLREELLLYAVHGLLHLLGYDDHSAAGARAMHVREDELLRAVGLGPVFAAGERKP